MQRSAARHTLAALALVAAFGTCAAALADTYPTKPVRVVVPYAPGGSSDQVARPFTERLSQALGQQFVVDNKGGASGAIGLESVMRAPADGYTILMTPMAPLTVLPALRKTPYDPVKDFAAVARLGDNISGLAVHPSVPANTLQEFVAYAKANPGKVNFGTAGQGSLQHLRNEVLNRMFGTEMVHIPYRGSAEALNDLLAGHIQMMTEVVVLTHAKAGKLKLLAVLEKDRHPDFPNVPSIQEQGYPQFDMVSWFATFAPAGTPRDIVDKLNAEIVKIARTPEMQKQMLPIGFVMRYDTADEMDAVRRRDIAKLAGHIKETGITIE